jgi:hypothetical protein
MSFSVEGKWTSTAAAPSLSLTIVAPPKEAAVLSPFVPQLTSCKLQTNHLSFDEFTSIDVQNIDKRRQEQQILNETRNHMPRLKV